MLRQNWLEAYSYVTDKGALALNDYARASDPFSEVAPDFGTSGIVGRSLLRIGQDGAADDEDETED